jgi:hypothetical protein
MPHSCAIFGTGISFQHMIAFRIGKIRSHAVFIAGISVFPDLSLAAARRTAHGFCHS